MIPPSVEEGGVTLNHPHFSGFIVADTISAWQKTLIFKKHQPALTPLMCMVFSLPAYLALCLFSNQ
jgi:hypothetical protein